MQLFSGLLNILSPMRGSSNRAPIESGSPSSDDDDQTEFRQVVNPKYTVEQHSPKKKSLAASIKSGPTRRVSIDKQPRTSCRQLAARRTSLAKHSTTSRRGVGGSKKKKSIVAKKSSIKVKREPTWERRSRRKSRVYKKGNRSETTISNKAWRGAGTRDDPLVLF